MEGPAIPVWGPALWSLFHSLAARTGLRTEVRSGVSVETEEKRLWRTLLLSFRSTIPCPACQKHYNEYIVSKNWNLAFEAKGLEWGTRLRTWFYTFHNAVRLSKNQPLDFTEEQLSRYQTTTKGELATWKQTLTEQMRRGMLVRLMSRDDMLRTIRLIEELILLVF